MIYIFGIEIKLPQFLNFIDSKIINLFAYLLTWLIIGFTSYFILHFLLRRLVRWIPGEIDDVILSILEKPIIVLITVFGTLNSLEVLSLQKSTIILLERIANTFLIIIISYIFLRVIKDIVIYYGKELVKQTESKVDDIILPIINLFGPIIVILVSALFIFNLWGINITSILVGAGILGLVLGLALQDTLSNIFGGFSLLIDAPFKTDDLILLSGNKICQVQKIGLRSTQLYSIDEHSLVHIPNKELANSTIVNITKPTVDLKVNMPISLSFKADLEMVKEVITKICIAHPNILVSEENLTYKIERLKEKLENLKNQADKVENAFEIDKLNQIIPKLELEEQLNKNIKELKTFLQNLVTEIKLIELGGINSSEATSLKSAASSIDLLITKVVDSMKRWASIPDLYIQKYEEETEKAYWDDQNSILIKKWSKLKYYLENPKSEYEMKLDDLVQDFLNWIIKEYKILAEPWKDPEVEFKLFSPTGLELEVEFYIDNIRLEHYERRDRVITELAFEIFDQLRDYFIRIPYQKLDVYMKS